MWLLCSTKENKPCPWMAHLAGPALHPATSCFPCKRLERTQCLTEMFILADSPLRCTTSCSRGSTSLLAVATGRSTKANWRHPTTTNCYYKLPINIRESPTFRSFKAQLTDWILDKQTCKHHVYSGSILCVQLLCYGGFMCNSVGIVKIYFNWF